MKQDIYTENWEAARTAAVQAGLQIIEHGWEQHVIIDNREGIVYRYPRHAAAAAKLADEVKVLGTINQQSWPIALPTMLEHNGRYASYKLIPGEVILNGQSAGLTDEQCLAIGAGLGGFLAQLHQLDHEIVTKKKTKRTTTLLEYYKKRINRGRETEFYQPAAKRLEELMATTNNKLRVVVHGDLHGSNTVIDQNTRKLNGVIDFSEVEIGNPHQEFRKIFMTDSRLLQPACENYSTQGDQILNIEEIILWAYVNEWSNLCHFAGRPGNITYRRAESHLKQWGEL